MSMDLLGYLVVGPTRLDKSREPEARACVKSLRDKAAAVQHKLDEDGEDYPEEYPDWLHNISEDVDEDWEKLQRALEDDPVANLFEVWESGARDVVKRTDPDFPERAFLFAGEGSWGDEPQGFGYQTLMRAEYLGLFDILGIH